MSSEINYTGPRGLTGPRGPQGIQGLKGDKGDDGQSITGPQGIQGLKGDKGDIGLTGPRGPKGDKGDTGDKGATGPRGLQGSSGLSAYNTAVANGFVGTEEQWLTSLVGPQGEQGPAGSLENLSATSPISYDSETNIISVASGYSIPSDTSISDWNTNITDVSNLKIGSDITTCSDSATLALNDRFVLCTKATSMNITVPPNSSVEFPLKVEIEICQYGAGQVTIVKGSEVTINSIDGALKSNGQYTSMFLKKMGTDEWYLNGDLAL